MSSADLFERFVQNLNLSDTNQAAISSAYSNITVRLNKDFWDDLESETAHRLQVGSVGRNTAVNGVSDLDMVFELPWSLYDQYKGRDGNVQSQLLQTVRQSIRTRYPNKDVSADGQIVKVPFETFDVEVVPAFRNEDDSYTYPDSNDGGAWRQSNPRAEIAAMDKLNKETGYNLKRVCRMLRAWKNQNGVAMSGWLIDTLAYNFFNQTTRYRSGDYAEYEDLAVSVFSYLAGLEHQEHWLAPGSGMRVPGATFQAKARKAANKCIDARDLKVEREKAAIWKKVFGPEFPSRVAPAKAAESTEAEFSRGPDEEFIEERYPVDIRYSLDIDCEVKNDNAAMRLLRQLGGRLLHGWNLRFFVTECDVPRPFSLYWKVRNVGAEAERRKCLRGDIVEDKGQMQKIESTSFHGDHYVEAYAVRNGVCVARARIKVPIA